MSTESYVETKSWMKALKDILQYEYFKVTEQSLNNLKDEGLPHEVLEDLKPIKEKEFTNENELGSAIEKQIGEEQTAKYKQFILRHTISFPVDFDLYGPLSRHGITVHDTIKDQYYKLSEQDKQKVLQDLWELARVNELLPGDQRNLYARMSSRYERFFAWEQGDEGPGWI